jgi:hypothetical protein
MKASLFLLCDIKVFERKPALILEQKERIGRRLGGSLLCREQEGAGAGLTGVEEDEQSERSATRARKNRLVIQSQKGSS